MQIHKVGKCASLAELHDHTAIPSHLSAQPSGIPSHVTQGKTVLVYSPFLALPSTPLYL